jgi:hypothetical protein
VCVCIFSPSTCNVHAPYVLLSIACPDLPYFSTLSHKWHNFWKNLLNIQCVLIFSTNFVWKIYHSKENLKTDHHKLHTSSCKIRVIFSDFNEIWNFSTDFRKISPFRNFAKALRIKALLAVLLNFERKSRLLVPRYFMKPTRQQANITQQYVTSVERCVARDRGKFWLN